MLKRQQAYKAGGVKLMPESVPEVFAVYVGGCLICNVCRAGLLPEDPKCGDHQCTDVHHMWTRRSMIGEYISPQM